MSEAVLIPVILAGGKGERFWPLSRRSRPKQFLHLDGSGLSLLQSTASRLLKTANGWDNLWVVTAAHIASLVSEQLPELPAPNLLAEPEGRDTAPALAWSTLEIVKRYGEDAIVGFFPADHWIADQEIFEQTLAAAAEIAAQQDVIVTLGIKPLYASTGYGYIEQGESLGHFGQGYEAYTVSRFAEKPDAATAEAFLNSGRYSWNGGMFVFRAGMMLKELETHAPEILLPLRDQGIAAYGEVTKLSIDYALMEKTQRATVLPVKFGWDDLGDWGAIDRLNRKDSPNVEMAAHIGLDTAGSLIYSTSDKDLIVTIGLEDLVIVRDGDVTLIAHKDRTQDIKKALQMIQASDKHRDRL
jgi:mannose-1-phosphate guanylyltransferase